MSGRILLETFPSLAGKYPYLALGNFPTPVREEKELAQRLDIGQLWIKCDNISGNSYGGNKIRKLELLMGEARHRQKNCLFTMGAAGSNHVTATSIYGNKNNFEVIAALFPQCDHAYVHKNLAISRKLGSKIIFHSSAVSAYLHYCLRRGKNIYHIPAGGSNPIGSLGYVAAAFELKRQVEEGLLPQPDYIYLAMGTCGTAAGLWYGAKLAGLSLKIIAVRVVEKTITNMRQVNKLSRGMERILSKHSSFSPIKVPFLLEKNQLGKGYAQITDSAMQAIATAKKHSQVKLDPTYTGKAFAAIIDHARQKILSGKTVLFWNTYNSREPVSQND